MELPGSMLARSVPLFYRVLFANVAIVVFGAVVGTYVTATTLLDRDLPSRFDLMLLFGAIGVVLSAVVNYVVLRAAFEPLDSLERLGEAVRSGDLSARASSTGFTEPQLTRLVDTFNATLDELEHNQRRLRELVTQVIEAQEGERRRIARELHDDTAQILFAQLLNITALKDSPISEVKAVAARLEPMTVDAIEGVRRLALELRPPALDDLGVREAIGDLTQRLAENSGIRVDFDDRLSRERLSPEIELVLYRVAQEALTNVIKHARATSVVVLLVREPGSVVLEIEDNGRGFDPELVTRRDERGLGLGLFGMEERAALVGGTLLFSGLQPQGTSVHLAIPLVKDAIPGLKSKVVN